MVIYAGYASTPPPKLHGIIHKIITFNQPTITTQNNQLITRPEYFHTELQSSTHKIRINVIV